MREGRADWVDENDPRKGIVCRELLYFGPRPVKVETADASSYDWAELPGVKFVPPNMEKNPTLPRLKIEPLASSAPNWEWGCENVSA